MRIYLWVLYGTSPIVLLAAVFPVCARGAKLPNAILSQLNLGRQSTYDFLPIDFTTFQRGIHNYEVQRNPEIWQLMILTECYTVSWIPMQKETTFHTVTDTDIGSLAFSKMAPRCGFRHSKGNAKISGLLPIKATGIL